MVIPHNKDFTWSTTFERFDDLEKSEKLHILKLSHWVFPTSIIKSFHLLIYSLFHTKIAASVTKSSHQDRGSFCLHLPNFYLYSPLFCRKKSRDCCFFSENYTTNHSSMIYITILLRQLIPLVYTMLIKIR